MWWVHMTWIAPLGLAAAVAGCTSSSPPPSPPSNPSSGHSCPSTPTSAAVDRWLARAENRALKGSNPRRDPPVKLVVEGRCAFEQAIAEGNPPRSRNAAAALTIHPRPNETRPFWLVQLNSRDEQIRQWAVIMLADLHAPEDLEPILRAYLGHPDLAHVLSSRLRDWRDRRIVPALVELLDSPEVLASLGAGLSLAGGLIPGVPVLEWESDDPNFVSEHRPEGYWTAPPMSHVQPYRRWWAKTGREQFSAECNWWVHFAGSARPSCPPD